MTRKFDYTADYQPDSSFIEDVTYNENTRELVVELKDSDLYYMYKGIEPNVFRAFKEADSAGAFYGRHIKGKFESEAFNDFSYEDVVDVETRTAPVLTLVKDTGISPTYASVKMNVGGRDVATTFEADEVSEVFGQVTEYANMINTVIKVKEITFKYV